MLGESLGKASDQPLGKASDQGGLGANGKMLLSFSLPPTEGLHMTPQIILGPAVSCGQVPNIFVPTALPCSSSPLPEISYLSQILAQKPLSQTLLSKKQD